MVKNSCSMSIFPFLVCPSAIYILLTTDRGLTEQRRSQRKEEEKKILQDLMFTRSVDRWWGRFTKIFKPADTEAGETCLNSPDKIWLKLYDCLGAGENL